jgi:hypothetical protein
MRKIREVLRLRFELGQRAIAPACSISQSTVHEYLNRAAMAGVVWPLGEEWDEQRVWQALFGERQVIKRLPRASPPRFSRLAFSVAAASLSDIVAGLGRVPADSSGRIRLQSLLRALLVNTCFPIWNSSFTPPASGPERCFDGRPLFALKLKTDN